MEDGPSPEEVQGRLVSLPSRRAGEDAISHSIPRPRTSLIGRAHEVTAIVDQIRRDDAFLVTLIGPGGVGKTRLAIAVAGEIASELADGIAFIPLDPLRDPALVLPTIANAFGLTEAGRRSLEQRLIDRLEPLSLLLVLDNLEHVVDAGPVISRLLLACPGLKILATSRTVLRLTGEHDVYIEPLPLPSAVELFVTRARAASSSFALTPASAGAVAAICARLDGLPLALELAAARVHALPPVALLARLDQTLSLLTGGARDQPDRLRTMRFAIAWSYDLLTPEEQDIFRRLSVFVGGFTLEAATAVTAHQQDIVNSIGSLVDKSILQQVGSADEREPRYRMLETVREFGLERLDQSGDSAASRQHHAAWYAALAQVAEPELDRHLQAEWQDRLEAELANVRQALSWATENDIELALRLAASLRQFWIVRGDLAEARGVLSRILAVDGGEPPHRVRALVGAAWIRFAQGEIAECAVLAEDALALARHADDQVGMIDALIALGFSHDHPGPDGSRRSTALRATVALDEALVLAQGPGNIRFAALATYGHASLASVAEDFSRATALFREALNGFEACGDRRSTGWTLVNIGVVAARQEDTTQAAVAFERAMSIFDALKDRWSAAHVFAHIARLALPRGRLEEAVLLLGTADAVHQLGGVSLSVTDYGGRIDLLEAARNGLSEGDYANAWVRGRSLAIDDAIAHALTLIREINAPEDHPTRESAAEEAGLTRREREVLRLLAAGRTDRQIGTILSISPRTAGGHVTNLLGKLGVESRTAAAAFAIRHGLD